MSYKEARRIFDGYTQHKAATQYTDNLAGIWIELEEFLPKAKTALDVGSAYSILPLIMAEKGTKVTASDMTREFINQKMLKDSDIKWLDLNLEKDAKIPGKYDLITMTEVIEHLNENPLPTIKKIYKALNPNGYFVCTTAAKELHGATTQINEDGKPGLYNDLDSWRDIPEKYTGKWKDQHTFHYDQFELISLITEAGFEVETCQIIANFSHLVIGRKCASR
jgi:SAM-dependent methyltransferase